MPARTNPIIEILRNRDHRREKGVYSCCSANAFVLRAVLRRALAHQTVALVEATANQVDQNGGYTGMRPDGFRAFLEEIARQEGFPAERLLMGGDHLGPLTWRHLPESEAMPRAEELVRAYILAGFSKIHIDTSMRLADDNPDVRLPDAVIARRGAELCAACERAFAEYRTSCPDAPEPVYVIGSEVPIPGGAQKNEDYVEVTSPQDFRNTVSAFRSAFSAAGMDSVWGRVVALVVQPGVEFADESVVEYSRPKARELVACLKEYPDLALEGHSTDYQPRSCLRELVEDGVAILKVGPALTFALREGLFALECVERELRGRTDFVPSHFRRTLEEAMIGDRRHWDKYYTGGVLDNRHSRAYSFSDRSRYYLPDKTVEKSIRRLLDNLETLGVPLALLSQYLPVQYERVRMGTLANRAEDILLDHIGDRADDYLQAVLR